MQRLDPPDPSHYDEEQKRIAASIAGTRGSIRGPFGVWLHAPGLAGYTGNLVSMGEGYW